MYSQVNRLRFGNGNQIKVVYNNGFDKQENHTFHLNSMYEFYICVTSDIDYIVGKNYYALTPYDVIVIDPYRPHKVILKKEGQYERFYMLIPEEFFSLMGNKFLHEVKKKITEKNIFSVNDEKKRMLSEMLSVFKNRIPENAFSEAEAVGRILELIGLVFAAEQKNIDHEVYLPEFVEGILKAVEADLRGDLSLEYFSKKYYLSTSYLAKEFKKYMSIGVKRYILMYRLGAAKEMICRGKSVTETCFECGFNDASYFTKIFKKYTGVTPRQYSKEHMSERE